VRVLVTGATGFIGRSLLAAVPSDLDVVAIARGAPPADPAGVEWVSTDLAEEGFERSLPGRVDAVVHLAQSRDDANFPDGARDMVAVNVTATVRLLEYARRSGAGRFVLASTATVYRHRAEPLGEDAPLDCSSFYAASKRSAELLARPYAELVPCHVLRLFTVYGAGQQGRLIAKLAERVRGGETVTVEGNRGLLLSPVHVDDVVATLLEALRTPPAGGFETTNVGGPDALGIRDIAQTLGRVLGREARLESAGDGEPGGLVADISKLRRTFDVPPPMAFEEGAARSW
jgi:UDP-glucose 4-epimerase